MTQPHDAVVVMQNGRLLAVTTYEEWRVTGTPTPGEKPYEFTWSPRNTEGWNTEEEARRYVELIREHGDWTDGPYLHKRTVTVTDWEAQT